MIRRRLPATLFAVVVAAAGCLSPARALAGWWEEAAKAHEADLDEVRSRPDRWRDVPVTFVVRFRATADAPADATSYPAAEWRAFRATATPPVPAHAAAAGAARAPATTCDRFVARRGSAEEGRIAALREGEEVRVRAALRAGGGTEPVLEVLWISGPADEFTPEERATLARADDLRRRDNAAAAEKLYREVLAARTLVPALRAELHGRIARACREQGRLEAAAAAYRDVLTEKPGDADATDALADLDAAALKAAAQPRVGSSLPRMPGTSVPVPFEKSRLAGPRDVSVGRPPAETPAPAAGTVPVEKPRLAGPRDVSFGKLPADAAAPASNPPAPAPAAGDAPPAPPK